MAQAWGNALQLPDRWFVPQSLGGHEGDFSLDGGFNDLATLGLVEGEGFFQKNSLAIFKGF
jgi:hypothetical protein